MGDGKRIFSRFYYTCPFYEEKTFRCSLGKKNKPYGCLAFNPKFMKTTDGKGCFSDISILRGTDSNCIDKVNQMIKDKIGVSWVKAPIPSVLLLLIDIFEKF